MTKAQQAELEQVAREWCDKYGDYVVQIGDGKRIQDMEHKYQIKIGNLVKLLADTERATLERVADEMERHPYWSKLADVWIKHLRQQAKEIPS